jgi:hypothetical protein
VSTLALSALLLPGAAAAQFKPLSGHEYRETIDPRRKVSGHMVVGVSLVDARIEHDLEDLQFDSRQLRVNLAGLPAGSQIRVDLESPDGRFHGTGMWQLESPGGGWQTLTLLDKGEPRRPRLPRGHLAISVLAFEASKGASPRVVLASLLPQEDLKGTDESRALWIQVNGRRGKVVVLGEGGAVPCEPVASASVVRFDTVCKIRVSQLRRKGQAYVVKLQRRDGFARDTQDIEVRF